MERLFLIGYRGTGKSTVARLVAEHLGWSWCDADALLEERAGLTIRQIFAQEGEAGFRGREAAVLAELCQRRDHVIATGGGVILRQDNRDRLAGGGVVWLKASPQEIWRRLQLDPATHQRRPDLAQGGIKEIEDLLQTRTPWYEACANLTLETDGRSCQDVADEIVRWMRA